MTMYCVARGAQVKETTFTPREFVNWEEFSRYVGQGTPGPKDGECFMQGNLKGNAPGGQSGGRATASNRHLKNVNELTIIAFDIDTGQDPGPVISKLEDSELAFVAYSSFSDRPDRRKWRLVFPLSEPFVNGSDLQADKKTWKQVYQDVAEHFELDFDRACSDLTRVFFTHRYDQSADAATRLFAWSNGGSLDLQPWLLKAEARKSSSLSQKASGTAVNTGHDNPDHERKFFVEGIDLKKWVSHTAGTFRLNDVVRSTNDLDVLSEGEDKSEVVCPFDDEHASSPGQRTSGFFVTNPTTDHNSFVAMCQHATCAGRDRLDFLVALFERGDVSKDDLRDAKNYVGSCDWGPGQIEELNDMLDGISLPYPFLFDYENAQVRKAITTERNAGGDFAVCGMMKPVATVRDENGCGYGTVVQLRTRDGQTKEVRFKSFQSSNDVTTLLRDAGLQVFASHGAERAFKELIAIINPNRVITEASRPSFHSDNTIFISHSGEVIKANENDPTEWRLNDQLRMDAKPSGTLSEWRDEVVIPCFNDTFHFPHMTLGILAGLAGPLVPWLGLDTCMINLSGPTSRGKTSALKLQASVWGPTKGTNSLRFEARGTANALEAHIERGNGVSIGLDELAHARDVGSLLFAIASGQGNNRMRTDGSGLRPVRRWQTFVMLTGEKTTRAYVEAEQKQFIGGMSVRCADVSVAEVAMHPNPSTIDKILAAAEACNGSAGPAFVRHLLRNERLELIKARFDEVRKELTGSRASGAEFRSSTPFALLLVAGEIAQRAGILPKSAAVRECVEWGVHQARTSSSAEAMDTIKQSIENVDKLISEHLGGRIIRWNKSPLEQHVPAQGIIGIYDEGEKLIYLNWDAFDSACTTDPLAVAKELVRSNKAIGRPKGKGRADPYHTRIPGRPNSKHIRIVLGPVDFDVEWEEMLKAWIAGGGPLVEHCPQGIATC